MGCEPFEGDEGVIRAGDAIRELAERFEVVEVVADPWRSRPLLLDLEADSRLLTVDYPQTAVRLVPGSAALYEAVIQGKLTHPDDPRLNEHVANCIAVDTPRGWRLGKVARGQNNDLAMAMLMAVDRALAPEPEVELTGWLDLSA